MSRSFSFISAAFVLRSHAFALRNWRCRQQLRRLPEALEKK
jgi:hypothetical protein